MADVVRRCAECNALIPQERLEVLPETTVCVRCSEAYSDDDTDYVEVQPKKKKKKKRSVIEEMPAYEEVPVFEID
jgi:hypothetical protein